MSRALLWGRLLCVAPLMLLVITLISACSDAPAQPQPASTITPLPTLALRPVAAAPTPTLDSDAPTRFLPTPLVTRSGQEAPQAPVTATPTAGPSVTPSATPLVEERLAIGDRTAGVGNYDEAAEQYSKALRQEPALGIDEQADTLLKLGRTYLYDERFLDAATILNQLIALREGTVPNEVFFWLGQAYAGQEEHESAVEAYENFLNWEPELGGYVYPLIAEEHGALGDSVAALAALEAAVDAPAFLLKEVEMRLALANAYLADGNTTAAIAQYDAVHDVARTEATRGQMTYLAGAAELAAGNIEAAHERFLLGIEDYPGAYESYLGLVELVKAEVPVDDYQRGVVDYFAAAYAPGIEALQAYIDSSPDELQPDAYLYLALSHEAMGDVESALAALETYAELEPAAGLLEQAKMQARSGDVETAVTLYEQFMTDFPEHEEAPFAGWWLAAHTADLGDTEMAIERFVRLAEDYPEHEDAAEALHEAASLALAGDDPQAAAELWAQAALAYPSSLYGSASLLALQREGGGDNETLEALETLLAQAHANTTYQEFRARDLAEGREPFEADNDFVLPEEDSAGLAEAETWLSEQFGLDSESVSGELSEELAADERLVVGRRLWQLGLLADAKRELESLRQDYADDPLSTYQLALFYRDLGLYRSSIIAAATLLQLAGAHELDAPLLIGRLSYPTYYAELIVPLAEQYGYDPRIQFSLVRQESLFESIARSGAAAQGLSQVIPETGAWIANRLAWPDYVNEDLYKPYVGLTFGAYYLAEQLDYFDGNVHAALAAYNAGPGNAARWYKTAGSDIDEFVDAIDFNETLAYVTRIYAGYDIYRHLYGDS